MDINMRLFDILEKRKLKIKDLASYLNINTSVVSTWKSRGTNPPSEYICRICDFLDISIEYLLTGNNINNKSVIQFSSEEKEIIKLYNILDDKSKIIIKGKLYEYEKEQLKKANYQLKIVEQNKLTLLDKPEFDEIERVTRPLYSHKASAGIGKYLYDNPEHEDAIFDLNEYPQARRADHVIAVEGDSMKPTIQNGQYIFVREQASIEHNEIGVFVYQDNVYCKRLHIDRKNKRLILVSDNEDYDDILIENLDELRTIGKVIL